MSVPQVVEKEKRKRSKRKPAQVRSENLGKTNVVQATPERRSKRIKERENKQTQRTTHTGLPLI